MPRPLASAALVCLLTLAPASTTRAQGFPSSSSSTSDALAAPAAIAAALVGSVYVGWEGLLLGLSIDRHINGHGLEADWAIVELVWGAVQSIGGALIMGTTAGALGSSTTNVGDVFYVGIPFASVGLYHVVHAIYSLVEGGPREASAPPVEVSLRVAAAGSGAELSLLGRL